MSCMEQYKSIQIYFIQTNSSRSKKLLIYFYCLKNKQKLLKQHTDYNKQLMRLGLNCISCQKNG